MTTPEHRLSIDTTPPPPNPWAGVDPDDDIVTHRRARIRVGPVTVDIEDVHDRDGTAHIEFVVDGIGPVLNVTQFEDVRTALELTRLALPDDTDDTAA